MNNIPPQQYNVYIPNIDLLYFVRFIIKDCLIHCDYKLIQNNVQSQSIQEICYTLNNRAFKLIKNKLINKRKRHNTRISSTHSNIRVYTNAGLINHNLSGDSLFLNKEILDMLDVNLLSTEKKSLLIKTLELNKRLKIVTKTTDNSMFENYKFVKTLGQGSYGKVFLVSSNHNKNTFALKVIKTTAVEENKKFLDYKIDFENIVKYTRHGINQGNIETKTSGKTSHSCQINEVPHPEQRSGIRLYVLREIYMMLLIKYLSERWSHRNISSNNSPAIMLGSFIKPISIQWSPNFIYMVMPAYTCNLRDYVNSFFKSGSHVRAIKFIIKRLLGILFTLHHEFRIVHRDIKPDNVLISHDGIVSANDRTNKSLEEQSVGIKELVLADYGLSRVLHSPHTTSNLTINVVTLNYKPPELILNYKYYDFSVDIWGIGCILYELITGRQLFNEHNEFNLLLKIFKRIRCPLKHEWANLSSIPYLNLPTNGHESIFKSLSNSCDNSLVNLLSRLETIQMNRLLEVNHNKRITAREALKHPFLI